MTPSDPLYLPYLRMMYSIGEDVSDADVQAVADRAERTVQTVQTRRRLGLRDNESSEGLYDLVVRGLDRAQHLKRNTALADCSYGDDWLKQMEARREIARLCLEFARTGTALQDGLTAHFSEQPNCGPENAETQAQRTIESLKLHPGADRDIGITDAELVERACLQFYAVVNQHLLELEHAADHGVPREAAS